MKDAHSLRVIAQHFQLLQGLSPASSLVSHPQMMVVLSLVQEIKNIFSLSNVLLIPVDLLQDLVVRYMLKEFHLSLLKRHSFPIATAQTSKVEEFIANQAIVLLYS